MNHIWHRVFCANLDILSLVISLITLPRYCPLVLKWPLPVLVWEFDGNMLVLLCATVKENQFLVAFVRAVSSPKTRSEKMGKLMEEKKRAGPGGIVRAEVMDKGS